MKCSNCKGFGWVHPSYTACPRCHGKGKLFPQFLNSEDTPVSVGLDLAVCLIAFLAIAASFFLTLFL